MSGLNPHDFWFNINSNNLEFRAELVHRVVKGNNEVYCNFIFNRVTGDLSVKFTDFCTLGVVDRLRYIIKLLNILIKL